MKTLTIQEEEDIIARAIAEWNAQHVQVLIDDDDIPEGVRYLPLESLIEFLEQREIPTRIIIAGEYYKVKLRKRVPYEEYRQFVTAFKEFLGFKPLWDREEKVLKIRRWRLADGLADGFCL